MHSSYPHLPGVEHMGGYSDGNVLLKLRGGSKG